MIYFLNDQTSKITLDSCCNYIYIIRVEKRNQTMTDFGMNTELGNAAVETIANLYLERGFDDLDVLHASVWGDVQSLGQTQAFEEASMVEVEVFLYLQEAFSNMENN